MPRVPPELSSGPHQDGNDPIVRLGQTTNIFGIDQLGRGEWTVLYEYRDDEEGSVCFYSGLLSRSHVDHALRTHRWDLSIGDGAPGFSQRYENDIEITTYDRFSFDRMEPILYSRDFYGVKPRQFDLSEEFRFFHNLYHDRYNDRYIHIGDRGREFVAAEVTAGGARVLTRLLRQYTAARQLALALFFDHRVSTKIDLKAVKGHLASNQVFAEDRCYSFHIGEINGRAFSRLVGKKIILPPPVTESGIWPYCNAGCDEHAEFIIGVSENGSPVFHSCDHDALANYFGANEDSPHYLTPVWFTRGVLAKYYDEPDKFSVEDGYIRCGSLWGIQIDNNLPDHVVVYLGDLGRDLDYQEQLYWKHFNVTPSGPRSSETNFRRSFLAEFADATAPDLVFKQKYTQISESWHKKFGWQLFRALHEADAHVFKQFRMPISESLGEFESQLLFLVKLLIDSLNDTEMAIACGGALAGEKSIRKLERYLEKEKYPNTDRDIKLLRTLYSLRSSSVAHAKGGRFDKLQSSVGLDRKRPPDVFRELLTQVNIFLTDLSAHFGSAIQ